MKYSHLATPIKKSSSDESQAGVILKTYSEIWLASLFCLRFTCDGRAFDYEEDKKERTRIAVFLAIIKTKTKAL